MSTQIAVRLPEDLVAFIDRLVDEGRAPSRAVVVARAPQRERRRDMAMCDAILAAAVDENDLDDLDDLDGLARHAASVPLDDLD